MDLILASTSPYRRRLLERLGIPFRCVAPDVDETALPGEAPQALVARLSVAKARAVARTWPEALVIGSDQVAVLDGAVMGKPGDHDSARRQLRASAGREVRFLTGVALVADARQLETFHVEPFSVHFRELGDKNIENYLLREQPYDCAGSFKCEGLGIALFEGMTGRDPTSLEGLPLIALTSLLAAAGIDVLSPPGSG